MGNELLDQLWQESTGETASNGKVNLDDLWKSSQTQEAPKQPQAQRFGVFGSVPEQAYQQGERNIMGNVFERPAAAIRSALLTSGDPAKAFQQGAINPGQVPSIQKSMLDDYYQKIPNFPGKTALGNVVSGAGMVGDTLTNPADMALMLAGKLPGIQKVGNFIGNTEPAKAFSQWLNKERQIVDVTKRMPKIMTDNWLVNKAKDAKTAVDETIGALRTQYKQIFEPHTKVVVEAKQLSSVPKTLLDDMGISEGTTVGELWEARDNLLQQISEGAWSKSDNLKRLRLKEEDLMSAAQKIKAVVLNSVPDETRKALLKLDPKYTEVMNTGRKILKTVYEPSTDTYKTNALISVYKNKDSAGAREAFERFSKFNNSIKQVSKDIRKYNFRQRMKADVAKIGGLSLGGYLAHRYISGKVMPRQR